MNRSQPKLIAAAKDRDLAALKACLQRHSCDVNCVDNDGRTALIIAADSGQLECVRACLQRSDCDVNATDNNGDTAVKVSARKVLYKTECIRSNSARALEMRKT